MNLADFPNPYDFANPVSDPQLFAGRDKERVEVQYYLDHAQKSVHAINLAVIGTRASGKTSFLNMIEWESRKRDFCTVRVDLDEGDASSQLALFSKLFDCLLTTACDLGAFGGLASKTYDTYQDMMYAYEVPQDKTFCPFLFPIQYAKAMASGQPNVSLSDTGFKRDLKCIRAEVQHPIAILLDECDVLTRSRVLLEKLRNIFMNTEGYMLVFTGTPALFPIMDDVFSPIVRQFKRINIGPFDDQDQTQKCIRKPLEKLGIKTPTELFDFETYHDVSEIHNLASGRPYEVQLICHFLFRRVQEGRAKQMELNLDVLDDVLRELQTTQDVSTRPVIKSVRELDKRQLGALAVLCRCNEHATFDQVWFADHVFGRNPEWTKDELLAAMGTFVGLGVMQIREDLLSFVGDDFDRIYCKYLARKYGVRLFISDMPYDVLLLVNLDTLVREKAAGVESYPVYLTPGMEEAEIRDVVQALADTEGGSGPLEDPFESAPTLAEVVYWSSVRFRDSACFRVATVTVSGPRTRLRRWYGCKQDNRCAGDAERQTDPLDELCTALGEPTQRAAQLGGEISISVEELLAVPVDVLVKKVKASGNGRLREDLGEQHMGEMYQAYTECHDLMEALFHGELGRSYIPNLEALHANNLGYLHLVAGHLPAAEELFRRAVETYETSAEKALPRYNLGIVMAQGGDLAGSVEHLRLAVELISPEDEEDRKAACLIQADYRSEEQALLFYEVIEPDLLVTAQASLEAIEGYLAALKL